jgi:hypothetical protein
MVSEKDAATTAAEKPFMFMLTIYTAHSREPVPEYNIEISQLLKVSHPMFRYLP